MKNVRLIAALLAATVVTSSVLAAEAPQEAPKGRLKTVRKQFNESLDRFKRCMQGKCTRWEALKVARDLTITAVAVVGVMYGVGKVGVAVGKVSRMSQRERWEQLFPKGSRVSYERFPFGTGAIGFGTVERIVVSKDISDESLYFIEVLTDDPRDRRKFEPGDLTIVPEPSVKE